MKKRAMKLVAFILVLCMTLPLFANVATALAADDVKFANKVETLYLGMTRQLTIDNLDSSEVKKITWKTNNKKIATVDQEGVITPVSVGTTTTKCTITYTDGKKKTLSYKTTVRKRIAAQSVEFTNIKLVNNAQNLYTGYSITLKKAVTPANTTDKAFYYSKDPSIATVSASGKIKGEKAGITMIEVRYGYNEEDALRLDNTAVKHLYVNVMDKPQPTSTPTPTPKPTATPTPTATPLPDPEVEKVELIGSQILSIQFSEPVKPESLIKDGKLVPGTVIVGTDEGAANYGSLTAALSEDKKELLLTASQFFDGVYSVVTSSKIESVSGKKFKQYAEILELKDIVGPEYVETVVDYTGWKSIIRFSEPISIAGLKIEAVSGISDATLVSYLKEAGNYKLSEDKMSLSINLYGHTQNTKSDILGMVSISGIRDTIGNSSKISQFFVNVRTDIGVKPLAEIVSVERDSKTTLKVTFSSELQVPGKITYPTGSYEIGRIDSNNPKVVVYQIPSTCVDLDGAQVIFFEGWLNYNATPTNQKDTRVVDFTIDRTAPAVTEVEMTNTTYNSKTVAKLTLTFNKSLTYVLNNPQIKIHAIAPSGDIETLTATVLDITKEDNKVVCILQDKILTQNGNFLITIPANMVLDKMSNANKEQQQNYIRDDIPYTEIPRPVVKQNTEDYSELILEFSMLLNKDSASNVNNYYVRTSAGNVKPVSAVLETQSTATKKATVKLKFAQGTFAIDAVYELVLNGIKSYDGSCEPMNMKSVTFSAKSNKGATVPTMVSAEVVSNFLKINMSESVLGSMKILIIMNNQSDEVTGYASGNSILIPLGTVPAQGSTIIYNVLENKITSVSGVKADFKENQPDFITIP